MTSLLREAADRLPDHLRSWLGWQPFTVEAAPIDPPTPGPDFVVHTDDHTLHVLCRATDLFATLDAAAPHLRALARDRTDVPVLVVPYMGPRARSWAKDAGVSWADLSGNADIHAPGLHVHVEGHANRYPRVGRPSSAFSPRYSRVPRVLLVDSDRWWRQVDLAIETGLPPGTVSKAVHRLAEDDLIERDAHGAVRSRTPSLLLDTWAQHDRFADNQVRRFHAVGRSGPDVLKRLADRLGSTDLTWAATGLAAAWQYTAFADFRLTTLYVDRFPTDLEALGLREVDRGENVWLVGPRDDGVFYGKLDRGCWCVHPVQAYLDLLGHPERAADAAADLRAKLLTWRA